MSRINTLENIQDAPAAAQPLLKAVNKQSGSVPNLFRITSNSPHTLEGYLSLNGALAKGTLPAAGYSDAQIIEIIGHVALNTLTNYLNETLQTIVDFPGIDAISAA